jgi:hypothetical protein
MQSRHPDLDRRDGFHLLGVLLIQLLVILPTFGTFLPITDGWYLAIAHLAKTAVPYRDFYVPFPPGTLLFEGFLPNLFANPFLGEQIVHVILWLLFSTGLYLFIRSIVNSGLAFFTVTIVCTTYLVQPGNIISGYFETMYAFWILGLAALAWWCRQPSKLLLWLSGLAIGIAAIVKQSVWLGVLTLLFLVMYFITQNALPRRNISFFIFGIITAITPVIAWALNLGITADIISQVTRGGGKSTGQASALTTLGTSLAPQGAFLSFCVTLILLVISDRRNRATPRRSSEQILDILMIILCMSLLSLTLSGLVIENLITTAMLVLAVVSILQLVRKSASLEEEPSGTSRSFVLSSRWYFTLYLLVLCAIVLGVARIAPADPLLSPLRPNLLRWLSEVGNFSSTAFLGVGGAGLAFTFYCWIDRHSSKDSRSSIALIVLISHLSLTFLNSFAGGDSIETWFLPFAVALALISEHVVRQRSLIVLKFSVGTTFVVMAALVAFQSMNPYDWFGVREEALSGERRAASVPYLKDFKLSERAASDYDELYFGASQIPDSDATQVLFGSRNIGLSRLLDLRQYSLECPVLWWDICPEEYAELDLLRIKTEPPDAIVWTFETESNIEQNEIAWRDRKFSALRKIQGWIYEEIDAGRYKILASTKRDGQLTRYQELHTAVLLRTVHD